MSVIIHLPETRASINVPGATPSSGLAKALRIVRDALAAFDGKPSSGALAAAVAGIAWERCGLMMRLLPTPSPQTRTSHIIGLDLSGTPAISITTVIYDEVDETFGQLHEGSFIAADVLRDVDALVRALTNEECNA